MTTYALGREVDALDDLWSPTPARPSRAAPALVLGAALIVAMSALARPFDLDGFWHVRTGHLVLAHGIPSVDPFSWTAHGAPWHLDSWLYDVTAAVLHSMGGLRAVTAFSLALFLATAWAIYRLALSRGARVPAAAAVAMVAIVLLTPWFAERAQMVDYVLFVALLVLTRRALDARRRSLALLAVVVVVWANFHLSFSLGVAVVGLMALSRALTTRQLGQPAKVACVAALAGLLNPYGISAYSIALEVRGASRYVQEWRHLDPTQLFDVAVLVFGLLAIVAMWRTGRLGVLETSAPVVVLLLLTADSIRMAPFLVIAAAPEIALACRRQRPAAPRVTPVRRRAVLHGSLVGLVVLVVMSVPNVRIPRPIPDTVFPVESAGAIPAGCRLLNEYNQGGYLLYRLPTTVRVSEDGRNDLYGEARLTTQQRVLHARPGWRAWMDAHRVDCVLVSPDRPLVARLRELGWRERARDASAVLLTRR